jgi:hypothetical protein
MFTTTADFITDSPTPNINEVSVNVQNFINKYEPKLITLLLGSELYALLLASPADARFVAIIEPYLHPAAVNYVFFNYTRRVSVQTLNSGAGTAKNKNSKPASVWPVMVENWNDMVDLNRALYQFLYNNPTYPEYVSTIPECFCMWGCWNGLWGFCWYDDCNWPFGFNVNLVDPYIYKNRIGL